MTTLRLLHIIWLVDAHAGRGVAGTVASAKVTKVRCVCHSVGVASQMTQQTCCQLVTDLLATFPSTGKLRGTGVMDFGFYQAELSCLFTIPSVWIIGLPERLKRRSESMTSCAVRRTSTSIAYSRTYNFFHRSSPSRWLHTLHAQNVVCSTNIRKRLKVTVLRSLDIYIPPLIAAAVNNSKWRCEDRRSRRHRQATSHGPRELGLLPGQRLNVLQGSWPPARRLFRGRHP